MAKFKVWRDALFMGAVTLNDGTLTQSAGSFVITAGCLTLTAGNLDMTDGDLTMTKGPLTVSDGLVTVTACGMDVTDGIDVTGGCISAGSGLVVGTRGQLFTDVLTGSSAVTVPDSGCQGGTGTVAVVISELLTTDHIVMTRAASTAMSEVYLKSCEIASASTVTMLFENSGSTDAGSAVETWHYIAWGGG